MAESVPSQPAPAAAAAPAGAPRAAAAALDPAEPPPAIRAWMDRLTVATAYDPVTGFIVAREQIALPAVLRDAPPLAEAIEIGITSGRPVVVFATADRCGPCQQFRKDALNDPRVIELLASGRVIGVHLEVDREGELADRHLGSRAIPASWLIERGSVASVLRGQRSAEDLLAWIERQSTTDGVRE